MSYLDFSIKKRDTTANSPLSTVTNNPRTGEKSTNFTNLGTFIGDVWAQPVLKAEDLFIADVNFMPCARTNWHKHEKGQVLTVTAGSGWVCDQGRKPRRITVGDIVWCPPGGIHWHGADDGSYMVHQATSLGKIDWYEPVNDEEYARKTQ